MSIKGFGSTPSFEEDTQNLLREPSAKATASSTLPYTRQLRDFGGGVDVHIQLPIEHPLVKAAQQETISGMPGLAKKLFHSITRHQFQNGAKELSKQLSNQFGVNISPNDVSKLNINESGVFSLHLDPNSYQASYEKIKHKHNAEVSLEENTPEFFAPQAAFPTVDIKTKHIQATPTFFEIATQNIPESMLYGVSQTRIGQYEEPTLDEKKRDT